MQQAPDVLGRLNKDPRLLRAALGMQLHMKHGVLQGPCDLGQCKKTNGRRTARQGMRQAHGAPAQRTIELKGPLTQLGQQAPGPLVSFIQVNVVKRQSDSEIVDHLDLILIFVVRAHETREPGFFPDLFTR